METIWKTRDEGFPKWEESKKFTTVFNYCKRNSTKNKQKPLGKRKGTVGNLWKSRADLAYMTYMDLNIKHSLRELSSRGGHSHT